jgi:recombinase
LERGALVKKLGDARQRARQNRPNYREGRKPFGFFAGEPETLKRMEKLREAGYSYQAIADTLNKDGLKARVGHWHASSVQQILKRNSQQERERQLG